MLANGPMNLVDSKGIYSLKSSDLLKSLTGTSKYVPKFNFKKLNPLLKDVMTNQAKPQRRP